MASNITHKYKGYFGSVKCDFEEGVLHGKILHIRDLVTYEAESPKDLKRAFEAAVDDYLETCAELGKDPDQPYTGTFNVRIGPELHYEAAVYATEHGMKLNQVVSEAVRCFIHPEINEVHINHDHNVHHEHVVTVTDTRMSAVKEVGFTIQDDSEFTIQDVYGHIQ